MSLFLHIDGTLYNFRSSEKLSLTLKTDIKIHTVQSYIEKYASL